MHVWHTQERTETFKHRSSHGWLTGDINYVHEWRRVCVSRSQVVVQSAVEPNATSRPDPTRNPDRPHQKRLDAHPWPFWLALCLKHRVASLSSDCARCQGGEQNTQPTRACRCPANRPTTSLLAFPVQALQLCSTAPAILVLEQWSRTVSRLCVCVCVYVCVRA
jgi:hypothetical protein